MCVCVCVRACVRACVCAGMMYVCTSNEYRDDHKDIKDPMNGQLQNYVTVAKLI